MTFKPQVHHDLSHGISLIGEGSIRRPSPFQGMLYYRELTDGWRRMNFTRNTTFNPEIEQYDNVGKYEMTHPILTQNEVQAYQAIYGSRNTVLLPGEDGCPPIPEPLRKPIKRGEVFCHYIGETVGWLVAKASTDLPPGSERILVERVNKTVISEVLNNNGRSTCFKCGGTTRDVVGVISIIGQVCDKCGL